MSHHLTPAPPPPDHVTATCNVNSPGAGLNLTVWCRPSHHARASSSRKAPIAADSGTAPLGTSRSSFISGHLNVDRSSDPLSPYWAESSSAHHVTAEGPTSRR